MIVLDTNVLSALMRPNPDPIVFRWLNNQPRPSLWTTSITIMEIRFGIEILPSGKRKTQLAREFEGVIQDLGDRIARFDSEAAHLAGQLMALKRKKGRPGEIRDSMIAGIVLAKHATLATRNTSDFEELKGSVVNPWNST